MERYIFKLLYNKIVTSLSKIFARFGIIFIGKNTGKNVYNFKDNGQSENIYIFLFVVIKISLARLLPELPLHSNSHNIQIVISRLISNIFLLSLIWETVGHLKF